MIVVIRKFLVAALVAAPIALVPMNVDAQQRGADRAEQARTEASQAPDRPEPRGLKKAFEGRTPPAALQRLFPALFGTPEPEPAFEPEPAPAPAPAAPEEECGLTLDPMTLTMVDCNGNVASPLGF